MGQGSSWRSDDRGESGDPQAQEGASPGHNGARFLKKSSGLLRQGGIGGFEVILAEKRTVALISLHSDVFT
jgi:hypothetical protein